MPLGCAPKLAELDLTPPHTHTHDLCRRSAAYLPPTTTPLPGVFMAGDWVAQGPGTHGAKGLCQEKAYVTGLQVGARTRVGEGLLLQHGQLLACIIAEPLSRVSTFF